MHLGSHFRALPSQLHIFVLPSTQPSYQAAFVAIPGVFAFGNRQPTSTQKLLYIVCFSAGHQKKLTLICSRYYLWHGPCNASNWIFSTQERVEICACMSCGFLIRIRNSTNDILEFAGRRPAIISSHCVIHEIRQQR